MHERWQTLLNQAVDLRRELHQTPELAWEEQSTTARIRQELDAAAITWRACTDTGTLATLAGQATGEHIALRGDIDGLPIQEQLDVAWKSNTPQRMHACGHDGHTAALLATARWLKQHEEHLPGPVTLVFQPAEEGGHGAREMVAAGALTGINTIYGWHNWPAIEYGQAVCPDGAVMAGNGTFVIELQGRGGHASQPELCRDPLLAASAINVSMQQIVARRLPPQSAAVVSITSIDGHSAPTVIRDQVTMEGSIRLADMADLELINDLITHTAESVASTYGVSASVIHVPRYQPTRNHPGPAAIMRNALAAEFGTQWQAPARTPIMASEDFSYYLEALPGAFALIGAQQAGDHTEPCHSPRYSFNDSLLARVVRIYSRLAGLSEEYIQNSMH